ncbi:MAG TPA: Na-translocating system protein MpsC family protein [Solirubrobacterales bacterium]|nr:Na-translocating system protein MpsC family protein [Solirubrobacterales bacterium]
MSDTPAAGGEMLAAISDGLASLHTRFYGRGPRAAKSYLLDGAIVTFLWDGFTKVEETLIAAGRAAGVADLRRTFQEAMREEFIAVVQTASGRAVSGYLSQINIEPNLAVEIFLLEPLS